jgi:hypothetical protein
VEETRIDTVEGSVDKKPTGRELAGLVFLDTPRIQALIFDESRSETLPEVW